MCTLFVCDFSPKQHDLQCQIRINLNIRILQLLHLRALNKGNKSHYVMYSVQSAVSSFTQVNVIRL